MFLSNSLQNPYPFLYHSQTACTTIGVSCGLGSRGREGKADRQGSGQLSVRHVHVSGHLACAREDSVQNILIYQSCPVQQAERDCCCPVCGFCPHHHHPYPFPSPERVDFVYLLVLFPRATEAVLVSQALKASRGPEVHRSVSWHDSCLIESPRPLWLCHKLR